MHEAGMSSIKEFNKVKAHVEAGTRSWRQVANEWADHYANKGRLLHDQPTEAMLNNLKFQVAELSKVVQLLIHVFTLWPSQGKSGRLPKRVRVAEKAKAAQSSGHEWVRQNGLWQCSRCLATTRTKGGLASSGSRRCKAAAVEEGSVASDLIGLGHKPVEVRMSQGAVLYICARCGKYVQTKKKTILEPCPPAAGPYGRAALARVARGYHPDAHVRDVRVASCWDCQSKQEIAWPIFKPPAQQPFLSRHRAAQGQARKRSNDR